MDHWQGSLSATDEVEGNRRRAGDGYATENSQGSACCVLCCLLLHFSFSGAPWVRGPGVANARTGQGRWPFMLRCTAGAGTCTCPRRQAACRPRCTTLLAAAIRGKGLKEDAPEFSEGDYCQRSKTNSRAWINSGKKETVPKAAMLNIQTLRDYFDCALLRQRAASPVSMIQGELHPHPAKTGSSRRVRCERESWQEETCARSAA